MKIEHGKKISIGIPDYMLHIPEILALRNLGAVIQEVSTNASNTGHESITVRFIPAERKN